ncbi:MAG TPA: hypothetical protein VGI03_11590 [Verrucomicrobiae bacterium]|jgi:hypothetical protein
MLPILSKLNNANGPKITKFRIILALAIAVFTDGLQLLLGPLGWAFIDDFIDVIAMFLTCWVLGFHWLLLPTFVLKLIPLADDLPTWTACTAAVIVLRKREQRVPPPLPEEKPPIEI